MSLRDHAVVVAIHYSLDGVALSLLKYLLAMTVCCKPTPHNDGVMLVVLAIKTLY